VSTISTAAVAVADEQPVLQPAPQPAAIPKPRSGANDNRSAPAAARLLAPETDVERYYKEKVETQDGSSLTATSLYEDYCAWCEEQQKEPLALPTFGREFGELGVQKAKVAGRVRYIGIALRSERELEEDKNLPALSTAAA
jgi:phage/plasmid-associated DNA primase